LYGWTFSRPTMDWAMMHPCQSRQLQSFPKIDNKKFYHLLQNWKLFSCLPNWFTYRKQNKELCNTYFHRRGSCQYCDRSYVPWYQLKDEARKCLDQRWFLRIFGCTRSRVQPPLILHLRKSHPYREYIHKCYLFI